MAKIILCTVCRGGGPRRGGLPSSAASENLELDIEAVRQAFGVVSGKSSPPTLPLPGEKPENGFGGAAAGGTAAPLPSPNDLSTPAAAARPSSSSASLLVNWETVSNPKGALQELLAKHGGTATYSHHWAKHGGTGLFHAVVQISGMEGLSCTNFAPAEGTGFNTKKRAEQAAARAAGEYIPTIYQVWTKNSEHL